MLELFGWNYRIEDAQGLASWALGMAWRWNVLYPAKRHEFVISPAGCVFHICEKPSYGLTDFFCLCSLCKYLLGAYHRYARLHVKALLWFQKLAVEPLIPRFL